MLETPHLGVSASRMVWSSLRCEGRDREDSIESFGSSAALGGDPLGP